MCRGPGEAGEEIVIHDKHLHKFVSSEQGAASYTFHIKRQRRGRRDNENARCFMFCSVAKLWCNQSGPQSPRPSAYSCPHPRVVVPMYPSHLVQIWVELIKHLKNKNLFSPLCEVSITTMVKIWMIQATGFVICQQPPTSPPVLLCFTVASLCFPTPGCDRFNATCTCSGQQRLALWGPTHQPLPL